MFTKFILVAERNGTVGADQLLPNSCAAYICSLVFCALLKYAGIAIDKTRQGLLEIWIYSKIWEQPGKVANISNAINFLKEYLLDAKDIELIHDPKFISVFSRIDPDKVAFCLRGDHAFLASTGNSTKPFLLIGHAFRPMLAKAIPHQVNLVINVSLANFNVEKIKQLYSESKAGAESICLTNLPQFFSCLDAKPSVRLKEITALKAIIPSHALANGLLNHPRIFFTRLDRCRSLLRLVSRL